MNFKTFFMLEFLFCAVFSLAAEEGMPTVVSPGSSRGVALVESRCPTFSWSGVSWAQKYRVVVFAVAEPGAAIDDEMRRAVDDDLPAMPSAGPEAHPKPVLSEEIAGGALSWTPGVSQALPDGEYSWCIGALDAGGAWAWSEPKRFRVQEIIRRSFGEQSQGGSKRQKDIDKTSLEENAGSTMEKAASKKGLPDNPSSPLGSEGLWSTFYGTVAGANNSADANANSFFGSGAGFTNTSGIHNTFIGCQTGYNNSSGNENTFVGLQAGHANSTGCANSYLGYYAGHGNTAGTNNTFIGYKAGHDNYSGTGNVFLGYKAGFYEDRDNRLVIDNSDTQWPLIFGEFDRDTVSIFGKLGVGLVPGTSDMEIFANGHNCILTISRYDGAKFKLSAMGASGQLGTVSAHPVNFMTNNVKRLTLAVSGNVGIGVTIPAHPLHMASGAYCSAGGTWTNASSLALKENIASLNVDEAVAALRALNPVKFNYKADASEKCLGFIAEEVPELVATNDRRSLSPMDIVAVLAKVVQEQQQAISELQAEVRRLKQARP